MKIPYLTPSITHSDRSFFIRQIALLIQSGVPLSESLSIVGDQTSNQVLRQSIKTMVLDVQNGHPFSVAVSRYPELFDNAVVAMIKSGEASGQLGTIFGQLAVQLESQQAFNTKVRTALLYPLFVVVVMIVVAIVLTTVIVPRLKSVFDDISVNLPLSTRIIMNLSDFLINYWFIIAVVVAIMSIAIRNLILTPGGRDVMIRIEQRIPVIGSLVNTTELVRFSRGMSMLLKAGVPIPEAIGIVAESSNNYSWVTNLRTVRHEVERGVPLSVALSRFPRFPQPLTEMIAVGEQTGQIDGTLENMASFYEQQADASIKALTALIEPVVLVIVAIGVGILVVSVILPIYNLAELQ